MQDSESQPVPEPANTSPDHRPLVVCPLEYERSALEQAGVNQIAELQCCGPGGVAMTRWADLLGATSRPVILAGLAGALHNGFAAGSAHVVGELINEQGIRLRLVNSTRLVAPSPATNPCTITSTAGVLVTASEKTAMHRRRVADLVDLESLSFGQAANRLGWRWAIVRGVSDGAETSLPANIEQWVDASGRCRNVVIASSILRRPAMITTLLQLRKDSATAMHAVASRIRELLKPSTG